MSTLDFVNELCADIDVQMREQKIDDQRRWRWKLTQAEIDALPLCPDYKDENRPKLLQLAATQPRWCVADVAEAALKNRLPKGDAVWLILQLVDKLPFEIFKTFSISTAEQCLVFAAHALKGTKYPVPDFQGVDWRYAELALKAIARDMTQTIVGPLTHNRATTISRVSRVCGLVVDFDDPRKAQQIHRLACLCAAPNGGSTVPAETERQLRHLLHLVS